MSDGTVALGGMDRGSFAVYGEFGDPDVAAQVLAQASRVTPAPLPENRPLTALVTATRSLLDQLRGAVENGTPLTAGHLPVGAVLDHVGDLSGHVLYLVATPCRCAVVVVRPVTSTWPARATSSTPRCPSSRPACSARRTVEPWFGQPGGDALMVTRAGGSTESSPTYVDDRGARTVRAAIVRRIAS